jgi:hypothetical protein
MVAGEQEVTSMTSYSPESAASPSGGASRGTNLLELVYAHHCFGDYHLEVM